MKSTMKVAVVAGMLWMLLPQGQAAEIEAGFQGMAWSSSAAVAEGLARVGGKGNIDYYVFRQRTYVFFGNEVPAAAVVYGYFDDRFFAVYADIEGIDLFSQIKSYIQRKYGIPSKVSRETQSQMTSSTVLTTHIWKLDQVQIKFKHDEMTGKMKIVVYYLPIAKRANAEIEKNPEEDPFDPRSILRPFPYQAEALWLRSEFMNF